MTPVRLSVGNLSWLRLCLGLRMLRGYASVIPVRWCNHLCLSSHPYLYDHPEPTLMTGRCEHNMHCPVCGFGWGMAPDPCERSLEGVKDVLLE